MINFLIKIRVLRTGGQWGNIFIVKWNPLSYIALAILCWLPILQGMYLGLLEVCGETRKLFSRDGL